MDGKWGHCQNCKYFGSPAHKPLVSEEAPCKHPVLSKYQLEVFGASGCTGFELRAGATDTEQLPLVEEAH